MFACVSEENECKTTAKEHNTLKRVLEDAFFAFVLLFVCFFPLSHTTPLPTPHHEHQHNRGERRTEGVSV